MNIYIKFEVIYIYYIVYYNSSYKSTFMTLDGFYQVWKNDNGTFRREFECGRPHSIPYPLPSNIKIGGNVNMHYDESVVCTCGEERSNVRHKNLLVVHDTNLYNMSKPLYLLYVDKHSCIHFSRL